MRLVMLAVGTRMPRWVSEGFDTYRRRLPPHLRLELEEIAPGPRRPRTDPGAAVLQEGEQLLRRLSGPQHVVALDERGTQHSTAELATALADWQTRVPRVSLLVGGPDGLAPACRERADELWSLSRLTLPHALVRVLVAEQLYRAWTILQGHPYHRA